MPHRTYTAAEVDAAIQLLLEPGRLRHAEEVVTHTAPALQQVLAQALHEGGWFGSAYEAEVTRAVGEADQGERVRAVSTLVAEQTRLGMFVGVAVGFELAHELRSECASSSTGATGVGESDEHADRHDPVGEADPRSTTTHSLPIHMSPSRNPQEPEREAE